MGLNPDKTTDEVGRPLRPVLFNTAKDGSGTWYFALVDADGHLQVDSMSALPAGTNVIGKVGIDQTTPGTTNRVDIGTEPSGSGAYTTPTHTAPSIGATTTVALASNANRLYALLVNDSNEVIYLKLGADAVLNQGIRLNASGGNYAMSKKLGNLYTGAINGICASGGKVLLVLEGV